MASPGAIFGSKLGVERSVVRMISMTTFAMSALNTGWCGRFTALSTLDIKSVTLVWSAVASVGVVQLRIETIDATNGKPTGNLYDASAFFNITPVAGTQTYTFATLPTAALVAGTEYALVLLTTTGGTTQTLSSHLILANFPAYYPTALLTAANGTTRTNFAESSGSIPVASFIMEDNTEEDLGFLAYTGVLTSSNVFTTNAFALKVVLTRAETVAGVFIDNIIKTGTPAGDLRIRIFNSSDATVSGTDRTVDKDSLSTGISVQGGLIRFFTPVTLATGTYRVVFTSPSSANSSNCWSFRAMNFISAASVPANFWSSVTTDITATPIVWTDSTAAQAAVSLLLDSEAVLAPVGMLVHPGMSGGAHA